MLTKQEINKIIDSQIPNNSSGIIKLGKIYNDYMTKNTIKGNIAKYEDVIEGIINKYNKLVGTNYTKNEWNRILEIITLI